MTSVRWAGGLAGIMIDIALAIRDQHQHTLRRVGLDPRLGESTFDGGAALLVERRTRMADGGSFRASASASAGMAPSDGDFRGVAAEQCPLQRAVEELADVEAFDASKGAGAMQQLALCATEETCCALPLPTTTPPLTDTRRSLSPTTPRVLLSAALDTKDPEAALAHLMARYKSTAAATGGASES